MEPLTLFAVTVGIIAGVHLVSISFERFAKGRYDTGEQQLKREDWYCFFQLSDLLGKGWNTSQKRNQQSLTVTERMERARRGQTSRPRLHV